MKIPRLFLGLLTVFSVVGNLLPIAEAAPCCGGGSALPSIITGDDRAQIGIAVSRGSIVGDAPPQGVSVFRADSDHETTEAFKLEGAYLVADRFQVGAGIPLTRRVRSVPSRDSRSTGLGDVTLNSAYEILPEETYSAWRPHGFLFAQLTLPTSPSVYDATSDFLVDARGRGFTSVALGNAWLKRLGAWDFLFSTELHRSFSRTLTGADGAPMELHPGFGGSGILGAGFSPGGTALRLGMAVSPVFEGGISTRGSLTEDSESQWVCNTSFQLGYAFAREWSSSLAYTDQTLLGPAKNASLSRTFALLLQKRWEL